MLRRYASLAAVALLGAAGCNDFLTGGDLSNDPNRPQEVSPQQILVAAQANLWAEMTSEPARLTGMWAQQFTGAQQQYVALYNYGVSEGTTGGFHQALYLGGGLVDLRRMQQIATASGDQVSLGIAQVIEGALIGTGADLFGDIVYSQALQGGNPEPDAQMEVYAQIQTLLDQAITNLAGAGGGPGEADVVYGGDPEKWTRLAYTLKARFHMHTAEVLGAPAYQAALAAAQNGITDPADNYVAPFSGDAGEQNFWYLFSVVNRPGYLEPNAGFVSLLESRNDPRVDQYFNATRDDLSDDRLDPGFDQPLVTAEENLLIWAEAAYRTGDLATAQQKLNQAQALAGAPQTTASGSALLAEILTEEYIATFGTIEPWNLYKRTCWPNLAPVTTPPQDITARLFYDQAERQTNTSLPDPSQQPQRNANDPANASPDPLPGAACVGQ
jgi:hypothetical protein